MSFPPQRIVQECSNIVISPRCDIGYSWLFSLTKTTIMDKTPLRQSILGHGNEAEVNSCTIEKRQLHCSSSPPGQHCTMQTGLPWADSSSSEKRPQMTSSISNIVVALWTLYTVVLLLGTQRDLTAKNGGVGLPKASLWILADRPSTNERLCYLQTQVSGAISPRKLVSVCLIWEFN